jgi:hypothetical protein
MRTWESLLGKSWQDDGNVYGPQGQAVISAFVALSETPWFTRVGSALLPGDNVVAVTSWEQAITGVSDMAQYGPNGHLLIPSEMAIEIIESPKYKDWWAKARDDVYDYFGTYDCIDEAWEQKQQDFVHEYVYEFVSFLFAEIIGGAEIRSTYFRQMLV